MCYTKRFFLCLCAIALSVSTATAQNCDTILKNGTYEMTELQEHSQKLNRVKHLFCRQSYSSSQEASSSGFSLGIPFEGVPLEIGGSHKDKDYRAWQEKLCKVNWQSYFDEEENYRRVTQGSSVIASVWLGCMNADGLRMSSEVGVDPTNFRVRIKCNACGDELIELRGERGLVWRPEDGVSCDFDPTVFPTNSYIMVCDRSHDGEVEFALNSNLGSRDIQVPPVPPAEVPDVYLTNFGPYFIEGSDKYMNRYWTTGSPLQDNRVTWYDGTQSSIVINGTTYPKGLLTHPNDGDSKPASVTYRVPEGYTHLQATIGLSTKPNETCEKNQGSVEFRVREGRTNGEILFRRRISGFGDAENIEVPLQGQSRIILEVTNADRDWTCDRAAWGNARFTKP